MKKFRFASRFVHLTYKTHLNPKEIIDYIRDKSERVIKCKIAHETGDKHHDYNHTHFLIAFEPKRIDTRNNRFFDFQKIHPNIQLINDAEHWTRVVKYLDKENAVFCNLDGSEYPDNTGFQRSLIDKIQNHKTFLDVVCNPTLDVRRFMKWARVVFDGRPRKNLSKNIKLRHWQKLCYKELISQNDRQVLWIFDEDGGKGKTVLSNYLIDCHNAFLCNGGKMSDISYAYNNEKYVVFDLPRSSCIDGEKDFTPYRAMECFKDGRIFSPKYESCLKRFEPAKVVIFANFLPDESRLSLDRWKIKDLANCWKINLIAGCCSVATLPQGFL